MLLSLFGLLILSFLEGLRFEVVLLSHLLNWEVAFVFWRGTPLFVETQGGCFHLILIENPYTVGCQVGWKLHYVSWGYLLALPLVQGWSLYCQGEACCFSNLSLGSRFRFFVFDFFFYHLVSIDVNFVLLFGGYDKFHSKMIGWCQVTWDGDASLSCNNCWVLEDDTWFLGISMSRVVLWGHPSHRGVNCWVVPLWFYCRIHCEGRLHFGKDLVLKLFP